jgi:hypothetical protein
MHNLPPPHGTQLTAAQFEVMRQLWVHGPATLKSDYVRAHMFDIAALASRWMVTSLSVDGTPSNCWRLSHLGAVVLWKGNPT